MNDLALNKTMDVLAKNGTSLEDYNYENIHIMAMILDEIAKVQFMGMSVSCILTGLKSEKSITYDTKGNSKSDRMKSIYHWVWQTVLNICCVNIHRFSSILLGSSFSVYYIHSLFSRLHRRLKKEIFPEIYHFDPKNHGVPKDSNENDDSYNNQL